MAADRPVHHAGSGAEWEAWLAANHTTSTGVRLAIPRTTSGVAGVSHPEALRAAIRFGWIDGRKSSLDDTHWLQDFAPRSARSKWSQVNRAAAVALIESGEMTPAGLAEVERARADGRWEAAYAPQRTAAVPADLQVALDADAAAAAFFGTLDSRNRYAILYRIDDAKRPATRADRIARFVAILARGEKLHP